MLFIFEVLSPDWLVPFSIHTFSRWSFHYVKFCLFQSFLLWRKILYKYMYIYKYSLKSTAIFFWFRNAPSYLTHVFIICQDCLRYYQIIAKPDFMWKFLVGECNTNWTETSFHLSIFKMLNTNKIKPNCSFFCVFPNFLLCIFSYIYLKQIIRFFSPVVLTNMPRWMWYKKQRYR